MSCSPPWRCPMTGRDSVGFIQNDVELECTVSTSPAELHAKVGHIVQVMLEAANSFEFRSGTERLEPALVLERHDLGNLRPR